MKNRTRPTPARVCVVASLALAAAACGDDDVHHAEDWHMETAELQDVCPMDLEGADVRYESTSDGVALSFTTEPARVPELRRRVRHLASMYEAHPPDDEIHWQTMEAHHRAMHGGAPMPHGRLPAVEASVRPIDDGARLELAPRDGEQLEALHEHAAVHHQRFHAGQCWLGRG